MSRKKAFLFMLISIAVAIIILSITLIKDSKSLLGYSFMGIFIVVSFAFLYIGCSDDSITKHRKIELEHFIKNHNELNILNYEISDRNAYIEMDNHGNMVYISIFHKRAYMDIFDDSETKKLWYLESLEDESLKREGFINLMRSKKGITLKTYKMSAEEIFYKVMQNL